MSGFIETVLAQMTDLTQDARRNGQILSTIQGLLEGFMTKVDDAFVDLDAQIKAVGDEISVLSKQLAATPVGTDADAIAAQIEARVTALKALIPSVAAPAAPVADVPPAPPADAPAAPAPDASAPAAPADAPAAPAPDAPPAAPDTPPAG